MKTAKEHFPVVLLILLYNVALSFKFAVMKFFAVTIQMIAIKERTRQKSCFQKSESFVQIVPFTFLVKWCVKSHLYPRL